MDSKLKNLLYIVFLLCILFNISYAGKLNIVTSYPYLKDLVENVGGDLVRVRSLAAGYEDPHFVEPRPSMVMKVRNADIIVVIGMGLDIWVNDIIETSRNSNIQAGGLGYLDLSLKIKKLEVPEGKVDASMGHVHPQGNPHYFTDPENVLIMVREITDKLIEFNRGNSEVYKKNSKIYLGKLTGYITKWRDMLKPFAGTKIIAYHPSWPYFEKFSGFKVVATIEPKPGIPPSATHLAKLVSLIRTEKVKLIINENYFPKKAPKFLRKKTGVAVLSLPVDISSKKKGASFIELWDSNFQEIVKQLQ